MERVCVGALMTRRRGSVQILLGKRSASRAYYPGVWDVPGGHCEPGEPPERTLVRELQEELGVTPTAWRPLGVFRAGPGEPEGGLALHLYAVSAWTGEPHNRLPEEHSEVEWFAVEDACGLELAHPGYPAVFRAVSDQGG